MSVCRHHYSNIDHLSTRWNYLQASQSKIIAVCLRTWMRSYASTYVHIRCADFKHMSACFSKKKKTSAADQIFVLNLCFFPALREIERSKKAKPYTLNREGRNKIYVLHSSSTHCFISLRLVQGSMPPHWACGPELLLKSASGGSWKCPSAKWAT